MAGKRANSDTQFGLCIHHGGKFLKIGTDKVYTGGVIASAFDMDRVGFGYTDLEFEIELVGYVSWDGLHYKVPNTQIYKDVNTETQLEEMLSHLSDNCKVLNVFVSGGILGRGDEEELHVSSNEKDEGMYREDDRVFDSQNIYWDEWCDYNSGDDSDYVPEADQYTDDDMRDDELDCNDEYTEARRVLRDKSNMGLSDDIFVPGAGECGLSDYEDQDGDVYSSETDEDEDEHRMKKRIRRVVFNPRQDNRNLQLTVGMRFQDGYEAREAIRELAIEDRRAIRFSRVSRDQCEAKCTDPCEWRVYCSLVKATGHFIIKTIDGPHTCATAMRNKQVISAWIAKTYLNVFRHRPDITARELAMDIRNRYNTHVLPWKLYKARSRAIEMLRGTVEAHYAKLKSYVMELMRADKEGRFELHVDVGAIFKGMYVGFSALRKRFRAGCRRVIGVDGAHLKTHLGGVLLCAIATDANNRMYPIAWAIVGVENIENWRWFLRILVDDLGLGTGVGTVFISDQQKGLLNAVQVVAPLATHRNCARHVYINWKKNNKGEVLRNLFWRVVRAPYLQEYNLALDAMKKESVSAYDDFTGRDTTKFCKCFINPSAVSDMILNNISETFNGYILAARGKHIIHMLEEIMVSIMERMQRKKSEMVGYHHRICPGIMDKVEKVKHFSRYCMVHASSDVLFEVEHFFDRFIVDTHNRTCSCREWDISGIPCVHAMATITFLRVEPANYVNEWFSVEKHGATYSFSLPPLHGEKMWPPADGYPVLPPPMKKMPGSPKKNRKRNPCEENPRNPNKLRRTGVIMTCSNCKQQGHNIKGCKQPENPKAPTILGKAGRPRKIPASTNTQEGSTSMATTTNAASTKAAKTKASTSKAANTKAANTKASTSKAANTKASMSKASTVQYWG